MNEKASQMRRLGGLGRLSHKVVGNPTAIGTPVKILIADFVDLGMAVRTESLVWLVAAAGAVLHPVHFKF